jgi:2-polyprenyl-3-methyl-5-hydroxy-6-metoxy-1,4-benzoquinol methylase
MNLTSVDRPHELDLYFEQDRPEVLALVPLDVHRILELGCAGGRLGLALKRRQRCHITGIDCSAEAAATATVRLDRVIHGDCEAVELETLFQPEAFDCLITADVLEHLRDPEGMLRRLLPFLTADACIVASIPNVRHAGVLEAVAQGHWTYQNQGILDRTHLRYFTRREIDAMFARLDFDVEERRSTDDDDALAEWERLGRPTLPSFGALSVQGLDAEEIREFFVVQWLVRCRATAAYADGLAGRRLTHPPGPSPTPGSADPTRMIKVSRNPLDVQLRIGREQFRQLESELNRRNEQLRGMLDELDRVRNSYQELLEAHALLQADLNGVRQHYALMENSVSWRVTAPLRRAVRRNSGLWRRGRAFVSRHPRARRAMRRLAKVMWWTLTLRLRSRLIAHYSATRSAGSHAVPEAGSSNAATSPVLSPRRLQINQGVDRRLSAGRGRLVCITHLLPFPTGGGNKYRVHRMLTWLIDQGWNVVLVVCPLPDEPVSAELAAEAAARYPNMIVCQRDGILLYSLPDASSAIDGLCGQRPRDYAALVDVAHGVDSCDPESLHILRRYCPDLLVEVLLHVCDRFNPDVLLAESAWMSRPFKLVPENLFKIIDTLDVQSMEHAKVAQHGIERTTPLNAEYEAELLNQADLLIAFHSGDARALRSLAPSKTVITVGADFIVRTRTDALANAPVVLLVASANEQNVKGLSDFLRLCWPLVLAKRADAELHLAGTIGELAEYELPGVRVLGPVDDLADAYARARVVINPVVAGTGSQIETVEALCHLRPVIAWPAGVDGLGPELWDFCHVVTSWYDFARHLIDALNSAPCEQRVLAGWPELVTRFSPERVYQPLQSVLDTRLPNSATGAASRKAKQSR